MRELRYRRLRAPDIDGQLLIEPKPAEISHLLQHNISILRSSTLRIGEFPLDQLRSQLRSCVLAKAHHNSQLDETREPDGKVTWMVAGHQPVLFHPGVWFKNFALSAFCRKHNAIGVNVQIDNDLCHSNSIRVPSGSLQSPKNTNIEFDRSQEPVPYEERTLHDIELFRSFGEKVVSRIQPFVKNPILKEHWPPIQRMARPNQNLGQLLSRFRAGIEKQFGQGNLEIPLSEICDSIPFRVYVAHIISNADRFITHHNQLIHEYRQVHRIRSQTHPVPILKLTTQKCELPFWIWSHDQPERKPLFLHRSSGGLTLTNQDTVWRISSQENCVVDDLTCLADQGIKIRPRAITNTLFLRIFLADLFLHGIGGAKYDQITDGLMERFFGFRTAPGYAILSATIRMPGFENIRENRHQLSLIRKQLREFDFHPERFLTAQQRQENQVSNLVQEKLELVHSTVPEALRRYRHHVIGHVNNQLQPYIQEKRKECMGQLRDLQNKIKTESLMGSREFSFCLFPQSKIESIILRN